MTPASDVLFVSRYFWPELIGSAPFSTDIAEWLTRHGRRTGLEFVEKSVHQMLKESLRPHETDPNAGFDFVYCAGLFDYVSDRVCKRLTEVFYHMVSPGGLLMVTNVDASKPFRHSMDYLLEWHLIFRNRQQMRDLVPEDADPAGLTVLADPLAVNLYLEIRKG